MSTIAAKLSKLKNANYRETEVLNLPDGTELIISTLTGEEDLELAEYLTEFVEGAFGHHTKLETLAHSVKWVKTPDGEEINLRNVRMIDTDETTDDGTPIKRRRHVFMRDIVRSWPDVVCDTLFARYAQMMEEMDQDVSKGIKVELGPDAMRVKIMAMAEEVSELIEKAKAAGLDIDDSILDFRKGTFKAGSEDELISALEAQRGAPEPPKEEVHPLDEQLERERTENPEVYPVREEEAPVRETPRRIRQ